MLVTSLILHARVDGFSCSLYGNISRGELVRVESAGPWEQMPISGLGEIYGKRRSH